MCGILGIINLQNDRPVDPNMLADMASTMQHRGPDGHGTWVEPGGQVGLAHRRLSIVDLSDAGRQPMGTPDEKVWVSFNGEIYNFPSVRRDLEARGCVFRSNSDTEVILHLYREYGEKFYELLDGDFGLGLWDCDKKTLILARDRAGVKPVYYTRHDGRFIFASEIKALLAYPGISSDIDEVAFYHYMTYLVAPPPSTLIKGVKKLEAASALVLRQPEKGSSSPVVPRLFKYWEPVPRVEVGRSHADLDEELASLFRASVRKRQMSDVPVGALFSGGVDSTLNLCEFKEAVRPRPVATFTVGMDNAGDFHDDSAIARDMAQRLGSEHHEVRINERDLLETAGELARLQDEPVSDPVAVPLYFVTRLAKQRGYTVLHAGEGADELFCGYEKYRRFMDLERKVWRPLAKLPSFVSALGASCMGVSSHPLVRKAAGIMSRRSRGQELFISSAVACYENEKQKFISRDTRDRLGEIDSFSCVSRYYDRIADVCPDATFLQKMTFVELQARLPELLLMRADKMSMAHSVEIRVPFLDRDLMDFAMRIPDDYKVAGGILKDPIKRLAAQSVRREDIFRPKTGFGVPIQQWFRGELGSSLREVLEESPAGALFDTRAVHRHLESGMRTVNEAFQVWVIYNLLVWHRGLKA